MTGDGGQVTEDRSQRTDEKGEVGIERSGKSECGMRKREVGRPGSKT